MGLFTISHIKTSFKLDTCSFESAAIIWRMHSAWKGKRILILCRLDAKRNTPFSISKQIRALRVSRILLRQYFLTLANARPAR